MPKCRFPECDSCINREHDPFQCDDCEEASNYEPIEEADDDTFEDMSLSDFRGYFKVVA